MYKACPFLSLILLVSCTAVDDETQPSPEGPIACEALGPVSAQVEFEEDAREALLRQARAIGGNEVQLFEVATTKVAYQHTPGGVQQYLEVSGRAYHCVNRE